MAGATSDNEGSKRRHLGAWCHGSAFLVDSREQISGGSIPITK